MLETGVLQLTKCEMKEEIVVLWLFGLAGGESKRQQRKGRFLVPSWNSGYRRIWVLWLWLYDLVDVLTSKVMNGMFHMIELKIRLSYMFF